MNPDDSNARRWFWYASETSHCIPLDRTAYATVIIGGRPTPLPEWVCTAPDRGRHTNASFLAIDVDVAEPPNLIDEINWTCDYTVRMVARDWLDEIRDLIDEELIGIGTLRCEGRVLRGWSTLHERQPPTLHSTEGHSKTCPLCHHTDTVLHGREYFSDPAVLARRLILSGNGLFIREEIALERNLRTPRGGFEPVLVLYEPELSR